MASLKPLWLSVGPLSERLRRADTLYLGLDFDGTLAPLVADPRETVLPIRAREVLQRLSQQPALRLGLLSSRTLDDLRQRAGLERVFLSGSSGLETRSESGKSATHFGSLQGLPTPLLRELESWCRRFPGAWLEPRPGSCALHFRAVAPALQPAFGAGVRRRIRPHQPQITLVHGLTKFEVTPADGWDKAAALEHWLETATSESLILYFGDDTRDEPAHAAIRRRGGIAVAVDRVVSAAEYALPASSDVIWFLEWLDREWGQRGVPPLAAKEGLLQPSSA